jgi:hypothetical protein
VYYVISLATLGEIGRAGSGLGKYLWATSSHVLNAMQRSLALFSFWKASLLIFNMLEDTALGPGVQVSGTVLA